MSPDRAALPESGGPGIDLIVAINGEGSRLPVRHLLPRGELSMSGQTRREVRSGLMVLALTGPLFTAGIILRGAIDITDITSLLDEATTPGFTTGWALIVLGFVLQIYGFFGLYRYLTSRSDSLIALIGFMLRSVGGSLGVAPFVFLAVNGRAIAEGQTQGDPAGSILLERFFDSRPGILILGAASIASVAGFVLFVIAMWRDGRLAKWTVTLFALSLPLLAIAVSFPTELLGAILWLISTSVIAWRGWQES